MGRLTRTGGLALADAEPLLAAGQTDDDLVAGDELSAAPLLGLPVHRDLTVGEQGARVGARLGEARELEELAEADDAVAHVDRLCVHPTSLAAAADVSSAGPLASAAPLACRPAGLSTCRPAGRHLAPVRRPARRRGAGRLRAVTRRADAPVPLGAGDLDCVL